MGNVFERFLANETLRRVLFKSRFALALAALVPLAAFMRLEWFEAAFAVSMFGQVIQTWSFASLVKNRELTMRGPYLLSRNPMYLGRFFMLLGFVILIGSGWAVAAYGVIYVVYMVLRVEREERRLRRGFGDQFEAYCARVNRFLPSIRRLGDREVWFFDWNRFLENNAHWNVLGTLLAYGLLWGVRQAIERGG